MNVINWIKTKLLGYVHSVESITSNLVNTVKSLEAHAEDQVAKATAKIETAGKLIMERNEHIAEAQKAKAVSEKIGALLS